MRENSQFANVNVAEKACGVGLFATCAFIDRCFAEFVAAPRVVRNGRCADSESRFLAIKKFFALAGFVSHQGAPKPAFRANRSRLIRGRIVLEPSPFAAYGESLMHARGFERVSSDGAADDRQSGFRCRAWTSEDRSRPADWPCRPTTSSPGRRTSRRVAAWLSPAPPFPGWPR
jgi:hypothetical protein